MDFSLWTLNFTQNTDVVIDNAWKLDHKNAPNARSQGTDWLIMAQLPHFSLSGHERLSDHMSHLY